MKLAATILAMFSPAAAWADIVVANRTIRPETVISSNDIGLIAGKNDGAFSRAEDVIGQEARIALYPGRPIQLDSIGPPALVHRNQIVTIRFEGTGLAISTDGRALERGGVGDRIRIMNLSSRATLLGYVQKNGAIVVKP